VQIVANSGTPAWSGLPEVVEELRIGVIDGPLEYEFGRVDAIDVDADGRLYVLDRASQDVRVFDSSGDFLHRIGKPGEGPGELSANATPVLVTGESVLVPDLGARSVRSFSLDGTPQGTLRFSADSIAAAGWGVAWATSDTGEVFQRVRSAAVMTGGFAEDAILRWTSDGIFVDTLLALGRVETSYFADGRPVTRVFGATPIWDVAEDGGLLIGRSSDPRVQVRAPDGRLERVILIDVAPIPVTEEMAMGLLPGGAREIGRVSLEVAATLPVVNAVMAGPNGTIWVEVVTGLDGRELLGMWHVFEAQGRFLGPVELPRGFRPFRVRDDRIYGVGLDEFDVQYVARLRLDALAVQGS
jgi:hypothetical protein